MKWEEQAIDTRLLAFDPETTNFVPAGNARWPKTDSRNPKGWVSRQGCISIHSQPQPAFCRKIDLLAVGCEHIASSGEISDS